MRQLSYAKAILEATRQCMTTDPRVFIIGLGVPDPGGIFGTTTGLREEFGEERVLDMPVAENGMTGIAIGAAIAGMRPIMTHQRVDFMLLAAEQLINQAAKWHYMFDGAMRVPLVVRVIIGRGWGQGPQHMQSLHSCFAHIPGLKVIMPFTPADAKGLLTAAVQDDNPVMIFEHRWLQRLEGHVPEESYTTPIGKAKILRTGHDVSILALSHMNYEALRAAKLLSEWNVQAEVVDVCSLRPLDSATILDSVRRTGRVVVADPDWGCCGFSAELLALVTEFAFDCLKSSPKRVVWPDYPQPVSPHLTQKYYPGFEDIAAAAMETLGLIVPMKWQEMREKIPHDIPDLSFSGPF